MTSDDPVAGTPVSEALGHLGITLELADGDLVETAIVVAKVIRADGIPCVSVSTHDGLTWYDQIALSASLAEITAGEPWLYRSSEPPDAEGPEPDPEPDPQ